MENEKIKNLFTGRQLDDKKWTSEMASADEDMGGYFFLQLFTAERRMCLFTTFEDVTLSAISHEKF